MKILMTVLSLINGGYMLIDGIYVLFNGKYIGPARPGPWSYLFEMFGIDVFKLGPMFIIFGLLWLLWLFSIWTNQSWSFALGVGISILSLWYLPAGTLISICVLILCLVFKSKIFN